MAQQLVLVTDDDPDVRLIFKTILESRGFAVTQAANGREAIESTRLHRPDLIYMDLMMPEMDGWEAMAILRADPEIINRIPVVAVTAYEPTLEDVRRAGFCAYLRKPITPAHVVRAAEICLNAHSQGERWINDLASRLIRS